MSGLAQGDRILNDAALPSLFRAADRASSAAQRETIGLTAAQMVLLIGTASFGAVGGSGGPADWAAVVLLLLSLAPAARLAGSQPQQRWYTCRAAAESIRTLSWKYMAAAAPFRDDAGADQRFEADLRAIVRATGGVDADNGQITDTMRHVRQSSYAVRRDFYLRGRIAHQRDWYSRKARHNTVWSRQWFLIGAVTTIVGVGASVAHAAGWLDVDLAGVAGAVGAAGAAWSQLKQLQPLAAAYSLTAVELELVATRAPGGGERDEADWSGYCEDAEAAISREHTMWLARRG